MNRIWETYSKDDLAFVKELFTNNGIKFRVIHEYRVYPEKQHDEYTYEPAFVEVEISDTLRANHLLVKHGVKQDDAPYLHQFLLFKKVAKFTESIPGLRSFSSSYRFLFFIGSISVFLLATFFIYLNLILPSDLNGTFCVQFVQYEQVDFVDQEPERQKIPSELEGMFSQFLPSCERYIEFRNKSHMEFPFYNRAKYKFISDYSIEVYEVERYEHVYLGIYTLYPRINGSLDLISRTTKIRIHKEH